MAEKQKKGAVAKAAAPQTVENPGFVYSLRRPFQAASLFYSRYRASAPVMQTLPGKQLAGLTGEQALDPCLSAGF